MATAAMKHMASNFAKLDKFEGVDFKRWQKEMHFLLSSMSVMYVLTTPIPEYGGDDATVEQIKKGQNSLEVKYMAEDASSKKYLVSNFTNYKMTASRAVMEQYNELLGIFGRFTQHKINMDEAIKDEALDKFKVFKTEVELQQGSLIKRFRTDRRSKYMDTLYFQSVDINMTAPYTPQQNDISERKNRVLKEMVNSMLSYLGLSQGKPNLNYLRFWGCKEVVRLLDLKLKTLGERGIKCIFVGYAEHSKAFRLNPPLKFLGLGEIANMARLRGSGRPNKVQVGFVCTMAEIGCSRARIGPSKSSQSLSIAHKWAVVID
ncbi:zinc finger, CCHC-type containing protein [Tanacetum coccineum]